LRRKNFVQKNAYKQTSHARVHIKIFNLFFLYKYGTYDNCDIHPVPCKSPWTKLDGIPMSSSLLFGDETCGSLVEEMSKAFLRSMGALKVHESGELGRFGQPL